MIDLNEFKYFDEYLFISPDSEYAWAMWSDINKLDHGKVFYAPYKFNCNLYKLLNHAHFSFLLNKKFRLPLQNIWNHYHVLNNMSFIPNKKYCIIFTDISCCRTSKEFIEELYKSNNITLVLVIVNTMEKMKELLKDKLHYFKLVYSFDKNDSLNFGFYYSPTNYSGLHWAKKESYEKKSDVFFVGMAKNRFSILNMIRNKLDLHNVNYDFYISGVNKKRTLKDDKIHYNTWLSYDEVIQKVESSNCILEIVDKNQSGVTLRTMEAIIYNKKLLTNNENVKTLPFYNKEYMQIFNKVEDINVEFITNKISIDYKYNGEFSPLYLIRDINKNISEVEECKI